jgi:hypothetical protein
VALSSAEAEYVAICSSCGKAVWLQNLITGLFDLELEDDLYPL